MYNPLLVRQLKKHIGPQWELSLPDAMRTLLEAISQTYDHHNTDRALIERAMELSSQELTDANNRLREEAAKQELLIEKLRDFILRLQVFSGAYESMHLADGVSASGNAQPDSDDTIVIAEYLAEQIERCRITEQQLLQSQARLTALVEYTTDLIWSVDTDLMVTGCNHAFRSVFPECNFSSNNPEGICHILDLCPPEEVSYWETLYNSALQGKAFRQEYHRETDSREVYYELSFTPIMVKGMITGTSVYGRDITERKMAEQELQAALKRERELNLLKTRFVGTVSHEFRTPLSGIMMSTELLDRYINLMNEEQRRAEIGKIRERVSELTRLMDDVLMQSAADSVSNLYKPAVVNVVELCDVVLDDISSCGTGHVIDAYISEDIPPLFADGKLLRYVLRNLLSNAVKYSPESSPVTFRVYSRYDNVFFQVSDRGIGIPDEELPLLFNPFFRASNTGTIKGTGLGLSIVKEFVDVHSGEISVDSRVNCGTSFTIRLPLQAEGRD